MPTPAAIQKPTPTPSPIPYSAGVTPHILLETDIKYFSANQAVAEILRSLAEDEGKNIYITLDETLNAVKTELEKIDGMDETLLTEYNTIIRQFITAGYYAYIDPKISTQTADGNGSGEQVVTENQQNADRKILVPVTRLTNIQALLAEGTRVTERYYVQVDPEILNKFFPSIPQDILTCLSKLKNNNYPSQRAFNTAINHTLDQLRALAAYMYESNEKNQKLDQLDEFINCELSDENLLEALASGDFSAYKNLENKALYKDFEEFKKNLSAKVLPRADKAYYKSDLQAVQMRVLPECTECSLPVNGVNYGFYPYWQASKAYADSGLPTVNPAYLNFSMFTHIAYLGLPIGDKGELNDLLHWASPSLLQNFIGTLHKYNVKRDIVLYSANWEQWGRAKNISSSKDVVYGYAEDHYRKLSQLNLSVKSHGGLNGVTLYFDNYGDQSQSTNIINYVRRLSELIQADSGEFSTPWLDINLALGLRGLNSDKLKVGTKIEAEDPNYFIKISELFLNESKDSNIADNVTSLVRGEELDVGNVISKLRNNAPTLVTHVLVFLQESSSRYKKQLRMQIENEFRGEARADALLKVVPVLGRLSLDEQGAAPHRQYLDDLVYLKYNFGGIGMANLPFTGIKEDGTPENTNVEMNIFSYALKFSFSSVDIDYINYSGLGWLGSALHHPALTEYISVCAFACPHRSWMAPAIILLLIVICIATVLLYTDCASRMFILSLHPAYPALRVFVGILIIVMFGCDPRLQPLTDIMSILLFLGLLAFLMYRVFNRSPEKNHDI